MSSIISCDRDFPGFQPASSSTHAARSSLISAEVQFSRCFNKLRALRPADSPGFRTELNLLLDQLISENYSNNNSNRSFTNETIRPQVLQHSLTVIFILIVIFFTQLTNSIPQGLNPQKCGSLNTEYLHQLLICMNYYNQSTSIKILLQK